MNNLHLVCNAHIDPVWLWELDEGIAETLSTYRVSAQFCEDYDGFIFNHNEALLYQWVEQYEPALFARIQKLVAEGKWHIMGGWFIQPDANMPSGESFVRQILEGHNYFMEKFGVFPRTCINFDAFGHTRGLVDILLGSGYDSYLFCRPEPDMIDLPGEDFLWEGFSGETIACHRAFNSYESHRGEVDKKITGWMEANKGKSVGMVLWGIGNHGGGPSRVDYLKIQEMAKENKEWNMLQSTPEQYFDELDRDSLGVFSDTLNPRYIGCYTSQIRIKQLHTKLESELFTTEKMAAHSTASKLMKYPSSNISKAAKDLLFIQFHDILPGTAIQPVEEYSINLAGHGLEELRDAKTHAFISLCSGQKAADDGQIPLLVYNPHPYEVPYIVECEFQLPDQNKNREIFANPVVYQNGKKIPCQVEKESSNFNVDWRKRSVFRAMLKPGQINRFDAVIEMIDKKPEPNVRQNKDSFIFKTKELTVHISKSKGTMDKYMVNGVDYLSGNGFLPVVIKDDENSWAHKERHFRNTEGFFKLMDKQEAAVFSGILADEHPESVRAIEDGPVRTIIEAVMKYEHSTLAIRYHLPKKGTQVKVTVTVYWNEKMKMLKLSLPTTIENGRYVGQQAYGSEKLKTDGEEMVSHRWNVLYNNEKALSVINNGTYGSDVLDSEMRLSLLRSPGYAAGKSDFSVRNPHIMPQDRFSHYIDQGERSFEFYLDASAPDERLAFVERESDVCNEKPMALSFFPTGEGKRVRAFAKLSDDVVTMPVFKRSENQKGYVVRLFNPTAQNRSTTLELPVFRVKESFDLKPYEVRSFMFDTKAKTMTEINFVEQAK